MHDLVILSPDAIGTKNLVSRVSRHTRFFASFAFGSLTQNDRMAVHAPKGYSPCGNVLPGIPYIKSLRSDKLQSWTGDQHFLKIFSYYYYGFFQASFLSH